MGKHKYPTQAQLKKLFLYDPQTGRFTHLGKRNKGKRAGHPSRVDDYWRIKVEGRAYQASWLAWIYMTGSAPKHEIDHENLVRRDDRFANLREATHSQNCAHKLNFFKKNKYGFRGVKRNHKRFSASVVAQQKSYYLGIFDTPEEAARAYDVKAKELFGEFARLNFPNKQNRDWLFVHNMPPLPPGVLFHG